MPTKTAHLIAQLLEIEQAIGKLDSARIRGMLFEAEESILEIEQQMIEILIENASLHLREEYSRRVSSLSGVPQSWAAEKSTVN